MKRQNVLIIITLLSIAAYFISLQFVRKERLDQTLQAEKSSAELELRIEQLNDLLQAIIQTNLARRTVEQEKPQPDFIQKPLVPPGGQEIFAQKEALGQELIQAKTGLALVRPMNPALLNNNRVDSEKGGVKQKENTADKSQIENLSKQLKEKENGAAVLRNQLDQEKANRQTASKNLQSISAELKMAKNTKSTLERAITETEKLKDELKTTNTLLKLEIRKSKKELTSLKNTLGQLSKEKQALAKELDEIKAASLGTEKLRKEIEQLRVKLELLNKTYSDLRNEYLAAQEAIKQNEAELGKRADRILVSEEKLKIAEVQLADRQLKWTDLEKESALSREQNVAVQLEREELKNQLQQAKLRLNELENQATQILKLLKPAGTTGVTLSKEESKRVEVELFPAENITREAGK